MDNFRSFCRNNSSSLSAWLFLIPGIIGFLLFKYYPILFGFFTTFFNYNIINPPGEFVGLRNYWLVLHDSNFYNTLKNNIEFFLVTMAINFWPPIVVAVLVNELRKYKLFFRTIYFIPAIAPPVAMIILWKYIWQPDYGFANYILKLLGLAPQLWLNNPALVKWCMRFPDFIMAGGLPFIIYLAALQDIPPDYFEAASIDGASFLQKIRYIVFPLIMPAIGIMFVLTLIEIFNYFDVPMIMTGGGPAGCSETMVLYAFQKAYRDLEYSYSNTVVLFNFLFVFIITVFYLKLSFKKEEKG